MAITHNNNVESIHKMIADYIRFAFVKVPGSNFIPVSRGCLINIEPRNKKPTQNGTNTANHDITNKSKLIAKSRKNRKLQNIVWFKSIISENMCLFFPGLRYKITGFLLKNQLHGSKFKGKRGLH